MIRPFGLRDVPAVRSLQRNGAWLDLFHHLLLRRSALEMALIAPVPWVGSGLAAYVWKPAQQAQAFVQMLKRPGRYEADLLFLAPWLDQIPNGRAVWESLLSACIAEAGAQGLRRLFASLPEGAAEIDTLAGLGWTIYTNEEVFVLPQPPTSTGKRADQRLRPRLPEDVWWLRRLYSIYTPQPVQHAEGHNNDDSRAFLPLAWWELTNQSSFVVDDKGDVQGGVQLVSGRRGHWLLLHGDPGDAELMAAVLSHGIEASGGSRWPMYCAVRPYQGGLAAVLQDHGFQSFTRRSRMIKHLALRVKAAEPVTVPNLVVERPGS